MIHLTGLAWNHPRGYRPLQVLSQQYQLEKGVAVKWSIQSLYDFAHGSIAESARKYDILLIDHPNLGAALAEDSLRPLDELLTSERLRNFADESAGPSYASYSYLGRQWALPIDAATHTSVYRPDLLDATRLPSTFDDVFLLIRELPEGQYIGLPLVATGAICAWLTMCASLGNPLTETQFVSAEIGIRALEYLALWKKHAHPACTQMTTTQFLDHLSREVDIVYCPLVFSYNTYCRSGIPGKELRFTDIPNGIGAVLGGVGLAVSMSSSHPVAAAEFGAWICGSDVQRGAYVENQGQPANRMAWEDRRANLLTNGFFTNTYASLAQAYLRPRSKGFHAFQRLAGDTIHRCLVANDDLQRCYLTLHDLFEQQVGQTT